MPELVFNPSDFMRQLRGVDYQCFAQSIFLADVCGNYMEANVVDSSEGVRMAPVGHVTYFATPEGKFAYSADGKGRFTEVVLQQLRSYGAFPDSDRFVGESDQALDNIDERGFRIFSLTPNREILDWLVGDSLDPHGITQFKCGTTSRDGAGNCEET